MQRRDQVRHSDRNALPESTIQPDATDVVDVAHEPLVLVWRLQEASSGWPTSTANAIFWRVAGGLSGWLVVSGALVVCSRWFPALASSTLIPWGIVTVAVLGSVSTAVIARLFRAGQLTGNQLTSVEAIGDGIRFQPITGSVRLMRWEDMRLLEVEEQQYVHSGDTFVTRFYALYDRQQGIISWVEWAAKEVRVPQPEGVSWDDRWALSRELVDVIYQRTGLVPRTFSKSLQRASADGPQAIPLRGEGAQKYPGTGS
jgi:hypothetical protein